MNLRASLWLLSAATLLGCGNPSLDVQIKDLGGEVPGIAPGPFHRAGQPCIDCHGPYKGAEPEMALAGTVFALPPPNGAVPIPVENVKITVTDAIGLINGVESPPAPIPVKTTNCAGNFWFTTKELKLTFPYEAKIECPDPTNPMSVRASQTMVTRISREGSCNACHHGVQNQSTPGWVVCDTDPMHLGMTVYQPITHDSCPEAVPAAGGSSSSSSSSSGSGL